MKRIVFATNNAHKVHEIKSLLTHQLEVVSLQEAGIIADIQEPHHTLEENAREKSNFIFRMTGENCFSEDTGLEIEALNGEPGVRSARYAGEESNPTKNIEKVLSLLGKSSNRQAQFKTVISLILDGKEYQFTGICKGSISYKEKGSNGFGYDSIFIPAGEHRTFAEMSMNEKNNISHRKKATLLFIDFLNTHHGEN